MSLPDPFPVDRANWENEQTKLAWQHVAPVGSVGMVAFGTNMTHDTPYPTSYGPLEWRQVDDEIQFRGSAKSISGVIPGSGSAIVVGLPVPSRQSRLLLWHQPLASTTSFIRLDAAGNLTLFGALSINQVALDHVRYSILPTSEA